MRKEMNWYFRLGLLISGIVFGINHFTELPEIISGFGLGLAIALEMIGIFAYRHNMSKIKTFKKNLFSKLFKPA